MEVLHVVLMVVAFVVFGLWQINQTSYPVHWDDGMYAVQTMNWAETVHDRGVIRGVGRGLVYDLPGAYLPMVFLTSLPGAMFFGSSFAIQACQLFWGIVVQLSAYLIGRKVHSHAAGIIIAFWLMFVPPYMYWSSKMLGEASLFGTLSCLLCMLTLWGDSLDHRKCFCIGICLGLGVLSKQHFVVLGAPAVGLMLIWRLVRSRADNVSLATHLVHVSILILTPIIIAGPWYFLHYKEVIHYVTVTQAGFLPHSIGQANFFEKIVAYCGVTTRDIGFPLALSMTVGVVWSVTGAIKQRAAWTSWIPVMLMLSGSVGLIAAASLGSVNPRFAAPAELVLSILSAIALISIARNQKLWIGLILGIPFALQILVGPLQISGVEALALSSSTSQHGTYSPRNLDDTISIVDELKHWCKDSPNVWVVGSADELNPPLVEVMLREKGIKVPVASPYYWDESELTLKKITARINNGDLIVCDLKPPTSSALMTKWDRELIHTFQGQQQYTRIYANSGEPSATDRFQLFQKRKNTDSKSATETDQ